MQLFSLVNPRLNASEKLPFEESKCLASSPCSPLVAELKPRLWRGGTVRPLPHKDALPPPCQPRVCELVLPCLCECRSSILCKMRGTVVAPTTAQGGEDKEDGLLARRTVWVAQTCSDPVLLAVVRGFLSRIHSPSHSPGLSWNMSPSLSFKSNCHLLASFIFLLCLKK